MVYLHSTPAPSPHSVEIISAVSVVWSLLYKCYIKTRSFPYLQQHDANHLPHLRPERVRLEKRQHFRASKDLQHHGEQFLRRGLPHEDFIEELRESQHHFHDVLRAGERADMHREHLHDELSLYITQRRTVWQHCTNNVGMSRLLACRIHSPTCVSRATVCCRNARSRPRSITSCRISRMIFSACSSTTIHAFPRGYAASTSGAPPGAAEPRGAAAGARRPWAGTADILLFGSEEWWRRRGRSSKECGNSRSSTRSRSSHTPRPESARRHAARGAGAGRSRCARGCSWSTKRAASPSPNTRSA